MEELLVSNGKKIKAKSMLMTYVSCDIRVLGYLDTCWCNKVVYYSIK